MNLRIKSIVVQSAAYSLVFLFVYSALSKILNFEMFVVELGKSPIINSLAKYIALIVPGLEILIAILLIFNKYRILALYVSFSLMVSFSTYVIIILKFSPYIPCSCGGVLENMSWSQHLIFNIGFVIIGAAAILCSPID